MRKLLLHPGRTGFMFVLDRETGELLSAEKFEPINWANSYDLKTGSAGYRQGQSDTLRTLLDPHLSIFYGRKRLYSFGLLTTNRHALHPCA